MTTYILHGGYASRENPNNDRFHAQFTQSDGLPGKPHILISYWAREKKEYEELFKRDNELIKNNANNKKFSTEMTTTPEDFESQIEKADVFYISGGDPVPLMEKLNAVPNIKEKFQNKVIIGSSAGAFALCGKSVDSFDWNRDINQGLCCLPFNVLCHWDVETSRKEKIEAINEVSNKHILTLDETESTTFIA